MASLMGNDEFIDFIKVFKFPLVVTHDKSMGTVEVKDEPKGEVCLRAMQKGNGSQPWIVIYYKTSRVKWSNIPKEELDAHQDP